ncbi:LPXTG cell wall anchor domain-containing protein [Enterococcus sp. LJL120]
MKKIGSKFLLSLVILFVGCLSGGVTGLATDAVGGQATVDGKITFYETSTEAPATSSSEVLPDTGGKLPQTGEVVRNYSLIGGGVILAILLLLYYRRKKEKEAD